MDLVSSYLCKDLDNVCLGKSHPCKLIHKQNKMTVTSTLIYATHA
jgi:hypothetical protein